MNFAKKVLAAGCLFTMLAMPLVSYANPAQTSPRTGVPTVSVTASKYSNVAISRVTNYVNVRTQANTTSDIVGKIYNNCAATILATVDGEGGKWYQIQSGTVNGYIKAEYFITGAEAEKIAKEIGTVYVTINTASLRLREKASTDSKILTLLSQDAEYIAIGEEGDFVQIEVDASMSGYVHKDYIQETVEFKSAVSLQEEQQQKEEADRIKKEAEDAIAALNQLKTPTVETSAAVVTTAPSGSESTDASAPSGTPLAVIAANPNSAGQQDVTTSAPVVEQPQTENNDAAKAEGPGSVNNTTDSNGPGSQSGPGVNGSTVSETQGPTGPGSSTAQNQSPQGVNNAELTSATRTAIVAYAKQFLGNPYVYGGTSLTNGADCSGFTMRIFEHFGINTGRSSRDQAAKAREISINDIQPGDLLFYASGDYINHVALYIGGGQIIHASNSKTGIIISTAYYRTPYKAATFLN
ncbi:MAG: C40 family peptidase [Lachnospiraceae bacterium]|nr:C40 family peptidase [Lachnospiraceae bacterium]